MKDRETLERSLIAMLEVAVNADSRMELAQDKTQHLILRVRKVLAQLGLLDRVVVPEPKFPVQDTAKQYDVIPTLSQFETTAGQAIMDWGLEDVIDADGQRWKARVFVAFDRIETPNKKWEEANAVAANAPTV